MQNDELYNSMDFQELLRKYESARRDGSSYYFDSDEFIDLAEYYLDNGQLDMMLATAEDGLRMHPDDDYLLSLKVNALISLHRFDDARRLLPQVEAGSDHDAYYFKGQLATIDGDDVQASRQFHKWLQIEQTECENMGNKAEGLSRLKDAYYHVMVSFTDLGTSDDVSQSVDEWAKEYLRTFSPLDGDDNDMDVARLCHDNDLTETEISIYSQCLDSNPYMDQGWTYLASLQFVQGQVDEALNSAENALAINPDDPQAIMIRAHAYYNKERYDRSLSDYMRYYEATGDDSCLMVIGRCLILTGRKEEGHDYLMRARDYATANRKEKTEQAYNRGFIADSLTLGGYYREALALINVVLRTFPDDVDYRMQRANILLCQDKADQAVEEYLKAAAISDKHVGTLMIAAGTLMEKNYYRAALFVLFIASESTNDPDHRKVFPYIANVSQHLGLNDVFLKSLRKACEYSPGIVGALWEQDLIGIDPNDYYERLRLLYAPDEPDPDDPLK